MLSRCHNLMSCMHVLSIVPAGEHADVSGKCQFSICSLCCEAYHRRACCENCKFEISYLGSKLYQGNTRDTYTSFAQNLFLRTSTVHTVPIWPNTHARKQVKQYSHFAIPRNCAERAMQNYKAAHRKRSRRSGILSMVTMGRQSLCHRREEAV